MFKRLMLATMTAVISMSMTARADDDVFLDEGDGDFDSMPLAQDSFAGEPVPEAKPEIEDRKEETSIADEPFAPSATGEELFGADPVDSSVAQDEPVPPKPVVKKTPVVAKPAAKVAVKKETKSAPKVAGVGPKGKFMMTTQACPMKRGPASEDSIGTTGVAKKIWVERIDSNWVRAWNKAGEPGYLSMDCVQ